MHAYCTNTTLNMDIKKKIEEEEDRSDSLSSSSTSCNNSRSSSHTTSSSSHSHFGWPIAKATPSNSMNSRSSINPPTSSLHSELETMKERFAKLLLGEDMSGGSKGVCPALTISNAVTNLCATVFGQLWRLEPLPSPKKSMWKREMDWLLSVTDHIVELKPSLQTLADGKKIEVMTCSPRSDLVINLPALRKLDNMLLEILGAFTNTEFWYVDQGIEGSVPIQVAIHQQEGKWWLPVPRVPAGGLSEDARKVLHCKHECANQILKAAAAINSSVLAKMEVPESYLESLPKNARACLGDVIYRYMTSEQFSPDCLLDCLDLSSEHAALEIANRAEAAIHICRRPHHSSTKSSWEIVRDLMAHGDNRSLIAERAEKLLLSLKQRVPFLTQTTLDTTKIQCNKDVGKSVLESYSRVLESLAFNIVTRIEDLLHVDDMTKKSSRLSQETKDSHKNNNQVPYLVPSSGTPYQSAYMTPNFTPDLFSPAGVVEDRSMSVRGNCNNNKPARRGLGVKRVLTNYLASDAKAKSCGQSVGGPGSASNRTSEWATYCTRRGGKESSSVCNKSSD